MFIMPTNAILFNILPTKGLECASSWMYTWSKWSHTTNYATCRWTSIKHFCRITHILHLFFNMNLVITCSNDEENDDEPEMKRNWKMTMIFNNEKKLQRISISFEVKQPNYNRMYRFKNKNRIFIHREIEIDT